MPIWKTSNILPVISHLVVWKNRLSCSIRLSSLKLKCRVVKWSMFPWSTADQTPATTHSDSCGPGAGQGTTAAHLTSHWTTHHPTPWPSDQSDCSPAPAWIVWVAGRPTFVQHYWVCQKYFTHYHIFTFFHKKIIQFNVCRLSVLCIYFPRFF